MTRNIFLTSALVATVSFSKISIALIECPEGNTFCQACVSTYGEGCLSQASSYASHMLTYYTIDNGKMTIQGSSITSTDSNGNLTYKVPRSAFADDTYGTSMLPQGVTSLAFASGVTSIGGTAFSRSALSSVDFTGVKEIGSGAFTYTTNLHDIDLSGVTKINQDAFGSSFQNESLNNVIISRGTTIVNFPFASNTKLFCEDVNICKGHGTSKIEQYTKEDGVYKVGDNYYSSAAKMMLGGTEEGCETETSCRAKIASASGTVSPSVLPSVPARADIRIYTIDEANAVAGKVNSFKIRYR